MTWIMGISIIFHTVAAVVWVGGMFFAYLVLRPIAAIQLEAPARLSLWQAVFKKFFLWVWFALLLLWLSGFGMIHLQQGFAHVGWHVHAMLLLALFMTLLFMYLVFFPYKRLTQAVEQHNWSGGSKALAQIRMIMAINLTLGLLTTSLGAGGMYIPL